MDEQTLQELKPLNIRSRREETGTSWVALRLYKGDAVYLGNILGSVLRCPPPQLTGEDKEYLRVVRDRLKEFVTMGAQPTRGGTRLGRNFQPYYHFC